MEETALEIKRGDTKTYTLTFKKDDGTLIDITGYTIFFTVKTKIDDVDNDAVIKKTITTHSNPTQGETKIELSSTDTNQEAKSYVFDIQIKTNLTEIITILEGMITITKDVTQRTS
jgi:hypothetical protein